VCGRVRRGEIIGEATGADSEIVLETPIDSPRPVVRLSDQIVAFLTLEESRGQLLILSYERGRGRLPRVQS
jgi:hypothetical protein